ncbi:MAG: hypothetical protein M3T55_08290 [Pseudomonadota bacterium]|nr:hypothetical protein [Pseudomonadota bacterium]
MTAAALSLALALMSSQAAFPPAGGGEPLPPGAPTDPYQLTAWCYGAMGEYLDIYERVIPDLRAIDKQFGSSVANEKEPYSADMAAARVELKVLAGAVEAAEKASPSAIAPQGAIAIKLGRSIWAPAELKTRRELARAWLSWAMPDRCDSTARALASNSALLGKALNYNNSSQPEAPPPPAADAASAPEATPAPPDAPDPNGPLPDSATPH